MASKTFIGIDPGLTGAVAIIKENDILLIDTPVLTVQSGKGNKRVLDVHGMADLLREHEGTDCMVLLEKVHAMPKQGVTSMFTFGQGYGIWQGLLVYGQLPHDLITPQAWKKAMLAGAPKEKDAARIKAMNLFPQVADQLRRKKDIGRADALLIAECCRRTHGGQNV